MNKLGRLVVMTEQCLQVQYSLAARRADWACSSRQALLRSIGMPRLCRRCLPACNIKLPGGHPISSITSITACCTCPSLPVLTAAWCITTTYLLSSHVGEAALGVHSK